MTETPIYKKYFLLCVLSCFETACLNKVTSQHNVLFDTTTDVLKHPTTQPKEAHETSAAADARCLARNVLPTQVCWKKTIPNHAVLGKCDEVLRSLDGGCGRLSATSCISDSLNEAAQRRGGLYPHTLQQRESDAVSFSFQMLEELWKESKSFQFKSQREAARCRWAAGYVS